MKVAFLNIYQGLVNRGAETFVLEVSKRLAKNHQVVIIGGSKLPPRRWPLLWRLFIDPQGLWIFFFTLKKLPMIWREKFDVVIPLNGGWQSALIRIVTWFYGGKMVISGQSGMGWDDRNNLWCFPDAFIPISSAALSWARRVNPWVRVRYIPNGVDLEKFTQEGRKIVIGLRRPIILCVAALTRAKRVDLTVKAVVKMKQASLLVVGDGLLKGELEKQGKELLGERFKLIKISYDEMPLAYRAADVFTIPSESHHSFEIVLTEAMATNLPVVANKDPIRREIVGDAGILVDPEKVDEYAQALEEALKREWGVTPRRQAEKFSWDKIASQYEELFRELRNPLRNILRK